MCGEVHVLKSRQDSVGRRGVGRMCSTPHPTTHAQKYPALARPARPSPQPPQPHSGQAAATPSTVGSGSPALCRPCRPPAAALSPFSCWALPEASVATSTTGKRAPAASEASAVATCGIGQQALTGCHTDSHNELFSRGRGCAGWDACWSGQPRRSPRSWHRCSALPPGCAARAPPHEGGRLSAPAWAAARAAHASPPRPPPPRPRAGAAPPGCPPPGWGRRGRRRRQRCCCAGTGGGAWSGPQTRQTRPAWTCGTTRGIKGGTSGTPVALATHRNAATGAKLWQARAAGVAESHCAAHMRGASYELHCWHHGAPQAVQAVRRQRGRTCAPCPRAAPPPTPPPPAAATRLCGSPAPPPGSSPRQTCRSRAGLQAGRGQLPRGCRALAAGCGRRLCITANVPALPSLQQAQRPNVAAAASWSAA
jgi:hypothetical protein